MYTLEDDQETSASLHKRDFANMSAVPEEQGSGGTNEQAPDNSSSAHHSIPEQITSSLKKLTTPDQQVANKRERRVALAALIIACTGVFITALDQTVVVTALPKIIADPGINIPFTQLDHAAWIISGYLLGFIIAMPLMGRVSDIYGRRRIFLLCLSIFGVGSILCGLAPTLGQLIDPSFLNSFGIDVSSPGLILLVSARFIQAIGGGAVVPVAWQRATCPGAGYYWRRYRSRRCNWPIVWSAHCTAPWLDLYFLPQCTNCPGADAWCMVSHP